MDGNSAPQAELVLAQVQEMTDDREKEIARSELRIKTVPMATDTCRSSALITGDNAAIALPPQMAVPPEISREVFFSILKIRPSSNPKPSVPAIEATANNKPSLPARSAGSIHTKAKSYYRDLQQQMRCLMIEVQKGMADKECDE
jgi:hypothetical protein